MMCHRIGLPPISTMGFGRAMGSSVRREPTPPASITAFMGVPQIDLHRISALRPDCVPRPNGYNPGSMRRHCPRLMTNLHLPALVLICSSFGVELLDGINECV